MGEKNEGLLKMLARSKKLGSCIKNIEYGHFSSGGCFFRGKKNRRLTKDAGQVFKKRGSFFGGEKTAGGPTEDDGLTEDYDQVLKMSRTPCPVEDPKS